MPGKMQAVASGTQLRDAVARIGSALGLSVRLEVLVGRRLWGSQRYIDVVVTDPASRRSLGIECKYQGGGGSAEEKVPTTIQDISAWPIPGIVVISGSGFSDNMRSFLYSSGKAVELEDLEQWLRLHFGLPG